MRVLVIGAGYTGANVLRQLRKNPNLEVWTVDPREEPYALHQGVISEISFHEALTSKALEHIIEQIKPDLVLVTTSPEDIGRGIAPGIGIFVEALRDELAAIANVPVIAVARATGR